MAKKIPFNVIFASDEDPSFPASELNAHGPSVHGWRSKKNTTISPQEIVLRLHYPAKICRIQVLAHQHLIPERIELWLHYSPKGAPSTPSSQSFDYLGFIALSDNSTTNHQSRELQSVAVSPRIGTHLKLRLGSQYVNEFNQNGQVALLAVNVLGLELTTAEITSIRNSTNVPTGLPDGVENTIASICDDLSFSMYVEESVTDIVRDMEIKKCKAVNDERFEYARKLKLCMGALRQAGERLGRYSLAKRQAVCSEDFTTARLRKEQIEIYRNAVFDKLQVFQLLEKEELNPDNDICSDAYATKPTLPSAPSLQDVASILSEATFSPKITKEPSENHLDQCQKATSNFSQKNQDEAPNSPQLNRLGRSPCRGSPTTSTGSLRRRNKSAPRNSYEDYDDRAVPALRHSQTNEFLRECQGAGYFEGESTRGRSKLNDRERRQAALPILIFGIELVESFYSKQFQDREDGLAKMRTFLRGQDGEESSAGLNKVARASAFLLHRSVRDAVFSAFNAAAETVRTLFIDFIPKGVTPSEVARCVDRLLPELLAKSGDPSARIHTLAQHTILSIAACPEVREQHLISPALSRPVGTGTHPRLALSRMQMLEQLVLSQGISNDKPSGLTCRTLSECGCSGIHHPAEPVRKVAERVLLLVYKVNPRMIRKQLPPDDDVTRRNLLYRQLFTEFDKLDLQRKKEMMQGNKSCLGPNFDTLSPPATSSAKQSPPVEIRSKNVKYESRTHFGFGNMGNMNKHKVLESSLNSMKLNDRNSSPVRRAEGRILKSKSGNCIEQVPLDQNKELTKPIKSLLENGNGKNKVDSRKSSNSDSFEEPDTELICPFCDWKCYGNPSQLDKHYWKACPILTRCPQCALVLEVAALNSHLTKECDAKISYINCKRCTEAVHFDLHEFHLMEDYCRELQPNTSRCPLCHDEVKTENWKHHLLTAEVCPAARRRARN